MPDEIWSVLLANAGAVFVYVTAAWLLSLVLRDASIVDIFWGLGFAMVGWVTFFVADGPDSRRLFVAILVSLWGGRLGLYLLWRNWGKGEDPRYQAMRRHWGARFPLISYGTVFLLQGALMWIVSLPVQVAQLSGDPDGLTWVHWLGAAVWAVGLAFESIGDFQLARFKADPANKGEVMDRGLWRYTRHPNYFGDFLVWWGLFIVAMANPEMFWVVIGPIVMTVLLTRVSGVPLLERSMTSRRPGYVEYVRRTSSFFPRPPKG